MKDDGCSPEIHVAESEKKIREFSVVKMEDALTGRRLSCSFLSGCRLQHATLASSVIN